MDLARTSVMGAQHTRFQVISNQCLHDFSACTYSHCTQSFGMLFESILTHSFYTDFAVGIC